RDIQLPSFGDHLGFMLMNSSGFSEYYSFHRYYPPGFRGAARDASRRFVVCVLDLGDRPERLDQHFELLSSVIRDTTILAIYLTKGLGSDDDPILVAERIAELIESEHQNLWEKNGHPRPETTLVGLGLGALLARKAYVFGRGQRQDGSQTRLEELGRWNRAWLAAEDVETGALKEETEQPWTRNVERMIFLGGMDLGWTPWPLRGAIPLYGPFAWRSMKFFGLPYIGRLARSLGPGTPFVANLAAQWTNLANREALPRDITFDEGEGTGDRSPSAEAAGG